MRKQIRFWLTCLCCITLMAGCAPVQNPDPPLPTPSESENTPTPGNSSSGQDIDTPAPTKAADPTLAPAEPPSVELPEHAVITTVVPDEEYFSNRDQNASYKENKSITIQLNGTSVSCNSKSVQVNGTTVTILGEGTYLITGTLENGQIIVDAAASDKPQLVLKGAHITSADSAAIYIKNADKVFITLADGTENTLTNGGSFTASDENNIDGALFSKQDLSLNGNGSLTVASPAGHGIVCKDDLVFAGGTYEITAAGHGIDANDSVRVANSYLTLHSEKDGIHTENTDDTSKGFFYMANGSVIMETTGDGISASAYATLCDGYLYIVSGGGSKNGNKSSANSFGGGFSGGFGGMGRPGGSSSSSESEEDSVSCKGLKAAGDITVSNGQITINSADDAIHADTNVTIDGGTLLLASGDDGIHADETLTINDGKIDISECYEGLEAQDIKVNGGDIKLKASDDGLNAAGGTDESGYGGAWGGDTFGGRGGRPGGGGGFGGMGSGNGSIEITGGTLYVNASGDGIDANGSFVISGGHTTIVGPTQGDTATLDYDVSGTITGGTFIGTGASGMMAQTFSDSEQGVIAVSVGTQAAGTQITLTNADGNILFSYAPELSFAVVILSSPEIITGEIYTISVGDSSGDFAAK